MGSSYGSSQLHADGVCRIIMKPLSLSGYPAYLAFLSEELAAFLNPGYVLFYSSTIVCSSTYVWGLCCLPPLSLAHINQTNHG